MEDIIYRLRCKYPVGPIVNGEPEFGWRDFSGPAPEGMMLPSPLMLEAAKEIESLRTKLAEAEKALKHYADRNEWSGYPWKLQYNSSHIDGDGWVTAETALNAIANESKTRIE